MAQTTPPAGVTPPPAAPSSASSKPDETVAPRPPAPVIAPKKASPKPTAKVSTAKQAPPVNTPDEVSDSDADFHGLIDKIVIKGNRKIETDAIKSKLISKVGSPFDSETIRRDIQELFNMGYFYNVEVDRTEGEKVTLTYTVTEKPSITEIEYKGNDELEDSDLKEAVQIKPYEILNMTKIHEAVDKLEKLYEDKGYFLARISYRLEPTKDSDNVKLVFDITENDKVKVKRITFIGNKKIPSGKLKSSMITQEGSFFSFISGAGAYKQDAFDHDVQMLNYLYFNEGYVQVKVDRPQVYVTPDKKAIYISIRVEEGEQFRVGSVDFTGDLLFSRAELFETTHIQEQGIFKYQVLQDDLKALQAKYGDLGYAYANPIPRTRVREADKEVDITFEIDKGYKVYIGKINMVGDSKTRDKVIRREMRIVEGELYNETRQRESLENIKRLGYFDEVNFNKKTPKGHNDIMDIDVVVKERNTGTIQIGAGYSSFNGVVFNGQVNQINFLGKGQKLGVSIDLSKFESLYKVSFTEPYLNDTLWSVGGDVFRSQRVLIPYTETKTGADVRVGHPLAPYLDGFIRYKFDRTHIDLDPTNGDPTLFPPDTANGNTSSVQFTLEYDKRDDRFAPSKGIFGSVSLEYAGLGGDLSYTKGIAIGRYYHKVLWDIVWRNNLTFGFISPNQPDRSPPFNELFLLGGANSLRGFEWFTVGHRRYSTKVFDQGIQQGMSPNDARNQAFQPYGGQQELYYNLEFQFPLIKEAGINGVVFYDVGEAEDTINLSDFRQDIGFGFRWFSPIGPLRFEWGFPMQRRPQFNESPVNFEFAIGAPF